jgi:hypothetical protein
MYSRDKVLPLHFLLILGICFCSLAVHLVAEGLTPVIRVPGSVWTVQGEQSPQVNELSEDNFILPSQSRLPVEHPAALLPCALETGGHSFPISPLLPPPNS